MKRGGEVEGRRVGFRFVIEPNVIVELNVKAAQWVGGWGAVLVEVTEVGGINGVTGQETRRQWGNAAGVELKESGVRPR
jgi:hypothetical protein